MLSDYLRDPMWAGIFAAAITILYLHLKAHINNEKTPAPNVYMKPSSLIFLLTYFIVSQGVATRESIMTEPF
jgi:hypothetical protein